jgi:hypothetical protein
VKMGTGVNVKMKMGVDLGSELGLMVWVKTKARVRVSK